MKLITYLSTIFIITSVVSQTIDDNCLSCICKASTQCRPTMCSNAGPSSYYCGPYLISWAYWADAGKPQDDPNNSAAFEKCLVDKKCAELTVRSYMTKFGADCNSDGVVNCLDYARIHKAGRFSCAAPWVDATDYWKAFLTCFNASPSPQPQQPVRPPTRPVPITTTPKTTVTTSAAVPPEFQLDVRTIG